MSAKLGITENGMVIDNNVSTTNDCHNGNVGLNINKESNCIVKGDNCSSNNNAEIMIQKDIKPEIRYDCCQHQEGNRKQGADQNIGMSLDCNMQQSGVNTCSLKGTDSMIPAEVNTVNLDVSSVTIKQEDNGRMGNNLVKNQISNNQSLNKRTVPNEQSVPNEHSVPNEKSVPNEQSVESVPFVSSKQILAGRQTNTFPKDLLHVLSVVEEDMRIMEVSTGANCKDNDVTDESDSSKDSSSSSSQSSSDDSDSESEEDEGITRSQMAEEERSYVTGPHKTKNELTLSDLPNIDPLDLLVDESVELAPLGEIESIINVEALVIIKSFENVPAVDVDSILFLENRSGFGKVFEIFGQVKYPHYCVRFNNEDEIISTNVEIGQTVYFAPDTKSVTNFVFLSQLNGIKGSDASWQFDQEPPEGLVEYSDDEAESQAKAERKRAYQLKKRNEAHTQEQVTTKAATSTKKQRPSRQPTKHPRTTPSSKPSQGGQSLPPPPRQPAQIVPQPSQPPTQIVPPLSQQPPPLRIPPPPLRIPPPGPSPRFEGQPFPPPLMGPPFHQQIQPHDPHRCSFERPNGPLPRNFMPQGPPGHIQPRFGPPAQGVRPNGPPRQNGGVFRSPFQNMAPPPPSGLSEQNNQLSPGQTWDGTLHNVRVGLQGAPTWITEDNALPNKLPMNQHHWPVGQLHTMVQEQPSPPPFIEQESSHNIRVGSQYIRPQPLMTDANGLPNRLPINQHRWPVSRSYRMAQVPPQQPPPLMTQQLPQNSQTLNCQNLGGPPKNVREYLDM